MINYWIRYFVYVIILLFFRVFSSIGGLVMIGVLLIIIEMNYLFDSNKEPKNKKGAKRK